MNSRTRIVLADDHPIVLSGLRNLILAEPDLEIVGEAATGLVALKLIKEKRPEIALIDISMPECRRGSAYPSYRGRVSGGARFGADLL